MALKKSALFKGSQPVDTPSPHRSGETLTVIYTHIFTEAVEAGDVLEIYPTFAHAKIVGFEFETENVGAIALSIGIVSGEAGAQDDARTCSAELISGVAANAVSGRASSLAQLSAVNAGAAARDKNFSIGLVPASNITAADNKRLHIRLTLGG